MRKDVILVTGAAGEVGQALIHQLADSGADNILAIDVNPLPEAIVKRSYQTLRADILDTKLFDQLITQYAIPRIFHLAALLSTRAEFNPEIAHRVNVNGTLMLLKLAVDQLEWLGEPVKFMFPSSVAVYGLPDLKTKEKEGKVKEWQWLEPITMYGCNKLYCERLGRYYARFYKQLAAGPEQGGVDFRAVRYPGLISAYTLPTGGTSDFGPEMIHSAAQSEPYECFVREDTRMSFMAMPDAVNALLQLESAPRKNLTSHVYNLSAFNPSAGEIAGLVKQSFPDFEVSFSPHSQRQAIVDSWPVDQDDSLARADWGWNPEYDQERAFSEYLIPNISDRYNL